MKRWIRNKNRDKDGIMKCCKDKDGIMKRRIRIGIRTGL